MVSREQCCLRECNLEIVGDGDRVRRQYGAQGGAEDRDET